MGELEKYGDGAFGDRVNWDAKSHQQLWEWFSQPQLGEMQGWMDAWTDKVAAYFQAAADEVDQGLRAAGVSWEGAAAQAMQDSASPLAEHALLAKDAATQTGFTTLSQFAHAKNTATALPEPRPVPDQSIFLGAPPGELAQHFLDVAEQEAAANEAEARARDLVRSYDTAADDAVGELPRFEPAPSAAVSKAAPTSTDVIKVDGTEPRQAGPEVRRDAGPDSPRPGEPGQSGEPTTEPTNEPTQSVTPPPGGQPVDSTSGQNWTPSAGPNSTTPPGPVQPGPAENPRPTVAPVTGLVTPGPGGQGLGVPRGTSGGPGAGGQPVGGRGPQTPLAPGTGVRGGPVPEGPVAARTAATTAGRGAAGMGMAPVGAGRSSGDEDKERTSPEYLHDYHDDFWDDTPPVAPAVIGDEDDD